MIIAFFTPRMIIGGAETYICTKAKWLVENGYKVVVFSEGGVGIQQLPTEVKHIEIPNFGASPLLFSRAEYTSMLDIVSSYVTELNVGLIEAHNSFPAIHASLIFSRLNVPFIVNILHESSLDNNPLLIKLLNRMRNSCIIYTLTRTMNAYMTGKWYSKFACSIVRIPVKGLEASNNKFGEDHPYFLSVCRMSDDKMYVKYLIEDFAKLLKVDPKFSKFKLKIVGDGSNLGQIQSISTEINKFFEVEVVQILGTVVGEKLSSLFENCFAYVGMGTTLLLAASAGKPTIIAGITPSTQPYSWGFWGDAKGDEEIIGIAESIRPHCSFMESMRDLLEEEKYVAYGAAAKSLFLKNYELDRIMDTWRQIYLSVPAIFDAMSIRQKESLNLESFIRQLRFIRRLYKIVKR